MVGSSPLKFRHCATCSIKTDDLRSMVLQPAIFFALLARLSDGNEGVVGTAVDAIAELMNHGKNVFS